MKKSILMAGAAAFALSVQVAPALAQETPAQENEGEVELKQDTIIISARKKDEGLLEAVGAADAAVGANVLRVGTLVGGIVGRADGDAVASVGA